jgi:phosphoglycolate phosphatase
MARIRAILFDKDGTLLDFHATWSAFARELAAEAAGGNEEEAARLLERTGYNRQTSRFEAGSILAAGTNAEVVAAMFPSLAGEALRLRIADADRRSAELARSRAVPLAGIVEALGILHRSGYRLGLATNDSTAGAEATLASFGIAHLFDAAFGYDAVANPKPAPDVVHAFAAATGLPPAEIAMVGDNTHDIITARNAGAGLALGVLSGTGRRSDLAPIADAVLDSVTELPAYLDRRSR